MNQKKGILLYSGGLDSLLSACLLMEQDIDLIGLNFILPFNKPDCDADELPSSKIAKSIGLPLRYFQCSLEYMEMVKNPSHGYGKNMNPCIDCKIYFLKKAKMIMEQEDASFIATGEVVGQRPMTQMKHMLNHIEKECDLRGFLLRPLSAKILKPTKAEIEGIVDRDKLLSINGRSRKQQLQLAERFNLIDYSSPSGGCLFTDKNISRRLKDLFDNCEDYNMTDIYLLTIGRHYRLHKNAKLIVSRNEIENLELEKYIDVSDYTVIPDYKGSIISVKGELSQEDYKILSCIAARYGKIEDEPGRLTVLKKGSNPTIIQTGKPVTDKLLDELRI